MDTREEINDFLTSRRANVAPADVGLPGGSDNRRVPGLRREEVAVLSNISVDYYTRIERGDATGVSESVLDAICAALTLSQSETQHLFDLMRAANATTPRKHTPTPDEVRPGVTRMVDALVHTPGFVLNRRLDVLHANPLGRALYAPMYADPVRPVNMARFTFLERSARDFWVDWEPFARGIVAVLRIAAGARPHDRDLSDLVGELTTRSDDFAAMWATHDVWQHQAASVGIRHPEAGLLELDKEVMTVEGDAGQMVSTYTAPPDTDAHERLALLASLALTPDTDERRDTATAARDD